MVSTLSIEPSPINVPAFKQQVRARKGERTLKRLIWGYFMLLIFEGALRKWVLPGLASPLLIVRDPLGMAMIFVAIRHGWLKMNFYLLLALFISFVSLCFTLMIGHGNIVVALYGLRVMLIHFPLIFIIGKVFDRKDVTQLGTVLLQIAIPMTILMAMQFYSSQSAWVNRGVGGDLAGGGFSGALGYFRPPGTFSFTNGLTAYYGLVAAYTFYFWLYKGQYIKRVILICSTFCLLAAIPFSISRTLFGEIIVSGSFALILVSSNPKIIIRMTITLLLITLMIFIFQQVSFFKTGIDAFLSRFEAAEQGENMSFLQSMINRILGGMYNALVTEEGIPVFGYGVGMGTNAGAKIMTGSIGFLISEGEWGRIIGEMGVLGIVLIGVRLVLGMNLFVKSFKKVNKGDALSWMLCSFSFLNLIQGQWAQPTALGFAVLSTGLTMAALKTPKKRILNEDNSY